MLIARDVEHISRVAESLTPTYDVEIVPSADAAIESAERCDPDLFLCHLSQDVRACVGFVRTVRSDDKLADIPIIILAASLDTQDVLDVLDAGADEFVLAPYGTDDLLARVKLQLTFADSTIAAARRSRLLRSEAETLNDIARGLTSDLRADQLAQRVTDAGTSLTGAEFGAFVRTPSERRPDRLELYAFSGASRERFHALGIQRNAELLAETFEDAAVVRSNDACADSRFGRFAPESASPDAPLPIRSYMAVPVISRSGETLGGLMFAHSEVGVFTRRSVRLVQGLAAQAAVALDNWRLMERTQAEVAERSRTEAALRDSENRFSNLAENAPVALFEKDAEGRYTLANPLACEALGSDDVVGKTDADLLPGDVAAEIRKVDQSVMEQGKASNQLETVRRAGFHREFLSVKFPRRGPGDVIDGICGVAMDVTATRQAEADRTLLAAIVDSSDDAIISMTLEGIITSWNAGAERMFGYSADEAIEQSVTLLVPMERRDEERDILGRIRCGEHIDHFQTIRVAKDGRRLNISLTVSAVRDVDGRIIGASKVARDITRQRQAEQALAESETRFRQLVDALPAAVYQCDSEGRITLYNDAAVELWGRTPVLNEERWCGAYRLWRTDGTEQALADCAMSVCLKERRPIRGEEVIIERPDGSRRVGLPNLDPLFDADGKLVGAVNVVMDITEQKRAEFVVREKDRQTIAILEGLPQLIWTATPDGTCDYISNQWVAYTGMPVEAQIGDRWLNVVHSDDRERVKREWYEAVERARNGDGERYQIDYRMRGHDGLYRWFSACGSPLRDEAGRIIKWIGSNTNIQDIRDAEAALRYSEEKFRNLADNMSQFSWMADENWWIYWYNRRWFEYTGTTLADMQGWGWMSVHHPDHVDRVVAGVKESWRTGTRWEDVFPLRSKDGKYRWFLSRAEPIRDATGRVVRWFGTNTDITKQLEFEAELKDAIERAEAASQAKDRFLAILSHELRTPLTPVLMLASSLESDSSLPAQVRRDAAMIRDNVRLETKLIDDLLDLSRITAGKLGLRPETVDLNESVVSVCEMCNEHFREKSIRLHCDLDENVHCISADPSRLQQVFWNVLKNAAKFTPEGGDIYVTTRAGDSGFYSVEVRDTGVGIESDNLLDIFDAFEQGAEKTARQFGGLGLGLAISKALVEFHHGTISAHSDGPGKGAVFKIELPSAGTAVEVAPLEQPLQNSNAHGVVRLLVVEDHAGTAKTLERILKSCGYEVNVVNSKAEALKLAATTEFDLLISDIGLPDGTGYELVSELKKRRRIRAIAISGYGMDNDIRKSRDAGFDDHLVKPLDISQLELAIRQVLRSIP